LELPVLRQKLTPWHTRRMRNVRQLLLRPPFGHPPLKGAHHPPGLNKYA